VTYDMVAGKICQPLIIIQELDQIEILKVGLSARYKFCESTSDGFVYTGGLELKQE
jgi:hypothetical protein